MCWRHDRLKKVNFRWAIRAVLWSIVLTTVFTLASTAVLDEAGYILAVAVLLAFIIIGIIFDMIGVAVTAADETPFHSMAAHKGRGAKEAIRLIKNADRVSNLCSDVVGDIAGIISGTTMALIAARLVWDFRLSHLLMNLVISGIVVGLTIGGKAIGKSVAIHNSTSVVLFVALIIYRKNWLINKLFRRPRAR